MAQDTVGTTRVESLIKELRDRGLVKVIIALSPKLEFADRSRDDVRGIAKRYDLHWMTVVAVARWCIDDWTSKQYSDRTTDD